jgi:hypothetical protein
MIKKLIKFPKNLVNKEIEKFFRDKALSDVIKLYKGKYQTVDDMQLNKPYNIELRDWYNLYRLFQFVVLNKRTTVLEFGSGWSSLILNVALNENKNKYLDYVKNSLRRNNLFELFVIENEKKFLNISKKRIRNFIKSKKFINSKVHFSYSDCEVATFNNQFATQYKKLPLCNPDFIYIDGPDQFNVKKKINNFTTAHKDMMPMACDILKIEYFLNPGTIIVIDGRGANAQFLKDNFKRKWLYFNDKKFDQHIFYLNAPSIGKYNDLQLKFYKS